MKRRPKPNKPGRQPEKPPAPVRTVSGRRVWLFRIAALLMLPLALCVLEIGLRLAGYGYPTQFFKKMRIGNEDFLVQNDQFSFRFFPKETARNPGTIRMKAHKPPGTYRIFILGESAAMGDPEPAFAAARYMEVLLRERFPEAKFEVVNLAFTAINSHVILPIAREAARHEGDLWVIYMGNNEMVGPFGATTVFGAQAPSLGYVRLVLAIQKTRVGQAMMSLARMVGKKSTDAESWGGMQMFLQNRTPPQSRQKETVYRSFDSNLRGIVEAGLNSGAKIVLNTVAVNLKDCPPFASMSNSNLPVTSRAEFDGLYERGRKQEEQGNFQQAGELYERAAKIDPLFAELQFRWGQCLLRLTNSAAREHLQLACDYDALPFRADTRINGAIRELGLHKSSGSLVLLDAEAALETNGPVRICGQESFYEHVHLNFDGNYRLGRAWAQQVEQLLPAAIIRGATADWPSQQACDWLLGLTDWNRSFVIRSVIKRQQQPPLNAQVNNARRLEELQSRLGDLRKRMDSAAAAQARVDYEKAIRRTSDDHYLRESFGEFLHSTGNLSEAIAQWRQVLDLLPHDYLAHFQLGRILEQQGNWKEAQSSLERAVELNPYFGEGWFELGNARFGEGKFEPALQVYYHARQLQPHDPRIYVQVGKALSVLKRSGESIENFQRAIRLRPDFWEAHYALGGELGSHDRISEAKGQFEEVVRLQPDFAMGHLNLGVALMKLDQLDDAQLQFEETLRLDAGNKLASDYLGRVQVLKRKRN